MKYICLGYLEPGKFEGMTEDERHAIFDECFEYNDHLRANGHLVAEVPLEPPQTAVTLYWKNGKVYDDRQPLCGNQRTARRHSHCRSARPQSCHSVDVAASRHEAWPWAE